MSVFFIEYIYAFKKRGSILYDSRVNQRTEELPLREMAKAAIFRYMPHHSAQSIMVDRVIPIDRLILARETEDAASFDI